MDILMVSAELSPFARATDAGDAVASLAKALKLLRHDVTVALPRHRGFEEQGLLMARRLTPLTLPRGLEVTVFDGKLPSGVQVILLDAPGLFDRDGVFEDPTDGKDYPDNAQRFGVFAEAVAALVRDRDEQGTPFDVVHGHDWPGALVPLALRASSGPVPPCLLTVHDGSRQGAFATKDLEALGLPRSLNSDDGVKLGTRVNILKGGLLAADVVTAVSPSYVDELADPDHTGPLAEVVRRLDPAIIGVPSGLDYARFNPATDPALVSRFDAEDVANKGRSKSALVRELELDLELERPLLVVTGELSRPGGFEAVASAFGDLLRTDAAIVVEGSGTATLEKRFAGFAKRRPDAVRVVGSLGPREHRRLMAAADIALVPHRHQPFARDVLIAQRYGALPVARAAGGARDAIVDCDTGLTSGTGFLYDEESAEAIVGAVRRAVAGYRLPAWARLRSRVMNLELSWDRPARRYQQLYRQVSS